jgi:hypothetical protein
MSTDDPDIEIAGIIAGCETEEELQQRITKHARILQHLVCWMVSGREHAPDRIRTLYADLAELAVEKINDLRQTPPRGKLH